MNVDDRLRAIREAIQQDVGDRGLARVPHANLFNACPADLAAACRSLVGHPAPVLRVVTGFWIPAAGLGETDGPLGAVFLARTLPALGIRVQVASDPFCRPALRAGLDRADCRRRTPVLDVARTRFSEPRLNEAAAPTHLLALERVGPAHTPASVRAQAGATDETLQLFLDEVPAADHDRCHTMRGIDITDRMADVRGLFDHPDPNAPTTIGIGDGGNEVGMGKVPWEVIRANIPGGARIACRIATHYLIVAGVSNWGAYALTCGVATVKGVTPPPAWFDLDHERALLQHMVDKGPLVDGVTAERTASVDGLSFEEYARPLGRLAEIMRS